MSTAARKKGRTNRLEAIAEQMRGAVADQDGAIHRPLPHGLHLVMQRVEGRWRLAMGREGTYPSDAEIETCRRAFNVPEAGEVTWREALHRHPKTGRQIAYFVAEVTWLEREIVQA